VTLTFRAEPLIDILPVLRRALHAEGEVSFRVPDPDLGVGLYAGEVIAGSDAIHRPYRLWLDVAERLQCHFLTPTPEGGLVRLHLRRRVLAERDGDDDDRTEKYGIDSEFSRVRKLEEVCFLEDALEALTRAELAPGARVLDLGVNTGEELRLFDFAYPGHAFEIVGVDHSASAIAEARRSFPQHRFEVLDITTLPRPELGRFDLVFSVGTLQSPGINQDLVFGALVREHLKPGGAFIVGLPNCRYEDGDISYGARMRNFRRPDLSLMTKDIAYFKRYFQRHDYRVFITGKYYVFITAVKVG
jgi:SAM-dependent methyltransferase